jgi:CRP-like cAMP-binding protein
VAKKPNNRLLAGFSAADWVRVRKNFEPMAFDQGTVLIDIGERLSHVYFPEEGVLSTIATFETGEVAETATTGPEGLVAVGAALGGSHALARHVVQVPGSGYRIQLRQFQKLQRDFPAFRQRLLTYVQVFLMQAMQSVACNGVHSIEERCARWLLMCHDRVANDRLRLTQEYLAEMLGVSRPSVNRVARMMQSAGLINYNRGSIEIEDRPGLEGMSCECYGIVRGHFDQLLPGSFER